jgi:hypothetical protein
MEGFGSGAGAEFIQINYESGCGSRRPKNIRIRIRMGILNTEKKTKLSAPPAGQLGQPLYLPHRE